MNNLTSREKKISWFLILPLYFFIGQFIIIYLFVAVLNIFDLKMTINSLNALYNLVFCSVFSILTIIVLKKFIKKSFMAFKGNWKKDLFWASTTGIVTLYVIQYAIGLLFFLFMPESTSANQDVIVEMMQTDIIPIFITTVILAPVLEELIFRGIIFNSLYQKNRIFAHFFSSFLFGFMHIYSALFNGEIGQLLYLIPYGVMGLVFSFVYEKKGNIIVPIYLHLLNNLISILLTM